MTSRLFAVCTAVSLVAVLSVIPENANALDANWSGNNISKTDQSVTGGVLNIDSVLDEIDVEAGIKDNNIEIVKDKADLKQDVYGQAAGLYITGKVGEIDADFSNNTITVKYNQAGKATANGGALAVYSGGSIDEIDGNFIGNKVVAEYTGQEPSVYPTEADGSIKSVISAGGGAIHIEGKYGSEDATLTTIKEINGNFVGNSATGDGYANGGAIYIKAGPNTDVEIKRIRGDFTNNAVYAKTTDSRIKASTGGAISLKLDKSKDENVKGNIWVDGNFVGNVVETVATDALGGAIYNEGIFVVRGSLKNNKVSSETGNAFGGAFYNKGNASVINSVISGNSAQKGGAIYNDEGAVFVFQGRNILKDNTVGENVFNDIYNDGKITVREGMTDVFGGIEGNGEFFIEDKGTLNINTATLEQKSLVLAGLLQLSLVDSENYGKVNISDSIVVEENGKLAINVVKQGQYHLFDGQVMDSANIIAGGGIYSMTDLGGGTYDFDLKSSADVAKDTGLNESASTVLVALAGADGNDLASQISLGAQQVLATGNTGQAQAEINKVAPETAPVAGFVADSMQNQILDLVGNRLSQRTVYGRSAGDINNYQYGTWAQGLLNKTKYNDSFVGDTAGLAVGADIKINNKYTLGVGYAYNFGDLDSFGKKSEVSTNSLFVYGQYKPEKWYLNLAMNYALSSYEETANVFGVGLSADYKADSFGGQIATGYNFDTGISPEFALRYLHVNQDAYSNGLTDVAGMNFDYLTAVAGTNYSFVVDSGTSVIWWPEISAALTYDIITNDNQVVANIAGLNVPYVIDGQSLSRLGAEFGIGLTADYNGVKISVNYMMDLHEGYTSQTGMLKFRYNF